jgi:hypothetical protein
LPVSCSEPFPFILLTQDNSHDHNSEFGDKAFLTHYPASLSVVQNWEKYAKTILGHEVDKEGTPGILNGIDDLDFPVRNTMGNGTLYPIKIGQDKIPIFPLLYEDDVPGLPEQKEII